MAIITIRVSDEEKAWLEMMAEFHGVTLTNLLKNYSMRDLEDEYDTLTAEAAHKEYLESGKKSYSFDELSKELELD